MFVRSNASSYHVLLNLPFYFNLFTPLLKQTRFRDFESSITPGQVHHVFKKLCISLLLYHIVWAGLCKTLFEYDIK